MWWWQRKREERELDEELKTHFELEARQDTDPDGARRAFGNITRIREETRETWGWSGCRTLLRRHVPWTADPSKITRMGRGHGRHLDARDRTHHGDLQPGV